MIGNSERYCAGRSIDVSLMYVCTMRVVGHASKGKKWVDT